MPIDFGTWTGLVILFLLAFIFSLFHACLNTFSKISLSRFLEERGKKDRERILDQYDETRIAVDSLRVVFIIAFLIDAARLVPRLRHWPVWLFLGSLLIFFIFFDYLPRLLNSLNKKAVLRFLLPSFRFIHGIAAPLTRLLRELEDKQIEDEIHEASEEEIETFIDEATEEGIIEEHEGELLKSVVEFGDTVVKEIMTPRPDMVLIRREATFGALCELIQTEKYSRIPVYKDRVDNIEGVVMAKDLLPYSGGEHKGLPIEPIIRPVHFVPESMKVSRLLKEFKKQKQKMAIVVDEHGGVSGLVTLEDLIEEIVGEIQDEYDQDEEMPITETGPGEFIAPGDATVEDIEDRFDKDIADEDSITVSGLITHHLGRLPKRGETFEIKSLSFEILEVDQKRIRKVKIRASARTGTGEDSRK
ncbi:MAG: hemolysin family protein [Candidatus Aminicenantales bacterium]